jgi:hypothetical protein
MPARKDDESLFSKIKRFVANPTTDWAELNSRQDPAGQDAQKSEIREMVERKRRNDFVRRRELDMLRRIRREGLGPDQVAALGNLSQIDDAESRPSDAGARADSGVKAKIDAIEQQMVGPGASASGAPSALARHPSGFFDAPTEPAAFRVAAGAGLAAAGGGALPAAAPAAAAASVRAALPPLSRHGALDLATAPTAPMPLASSAMAPALPPATPAIASAGDLQHDPELDEAVIAFANADFDQCERAIVALTAASGRRAGHVETWLARFDLYRATGQHDKFEALALEYAQRFGQSAPQWFSLPRLVADTVAAQTARPAARRQGSAQADAAEPAGWVCPALLDGEALARLRAQSLQMPLPWVLDWSAVERVEPDAAAHLSVLLRHWATQPIEMHWRHGERLLAVLAAQSPTGMRDADPAFWVTRLDVLRLANRPAPFDETAIDYCVTYEVSPPSWERARCTLHLVDGAADGTAAAGSEISTSFFESSILDEVDGIGRLAQVDLSGQLLGGITATLEQLDAQIGDAAHLQVNCARLIRVDFLAAGDLLNWVLAKRAQGREVSFVEMHRLVGLFFGAMGINEQARVRVRRV